MARGVPFYGRKGKLRQEHVNYINALSSSHKKPGVERSIKNMFDDRPRTQETIDEHFIILQHRVDGIPYNPMYMGHC